MTEAQLPRLQAEDTLFVPFIGPTVGVGGYVQRPGIFELLEPRITVSKALDLAGGLTPFSFTALARIESTEAGRERVRMDLKLNAEGLAQTMGNGQLLLVGAIGQQRQSLVQIVGEVARPGDYQYTPGMRLSDLVLKADGLTMDAYLPQVFISRQMTEARAETTGQLSTQVGHTRRVLVADLSRALKLDPEHDLELMPLDLVTVRSRGLSRPRPEVEIIGAVRQPGIYELTAGMRLSDLLAIAGNPVAIAYLQEAELIRTELNAEGQPFSHTC